MAKRKNAVTKVKTSNTATNSSPDQVVHELLGRVVADPELRYTPNGKAVCNFRIAVDHDNGRDTEFRRLQAWGPLAEKVIALYAKKGRMVTVKGRSRTDEWTDKTTGEKKSRTYLVVSQFRFVSSTPAAEHVA